MPSDVIKSFAKKSGKSVEEVEKLWDQAKAIATEKGLKDESLYAYATATLKKMCKIEEAYKVGDTVTYTSVKSGKRKKKGKVVKIDTKGGDTRYELDNGAMVYDSDLLEEDETSGGDASPSAESTATGNVAMPAGMVKKSGPAGKMPCGAPYFNCSDEQFWTLHTHARKDRGWFNKHYKDSDIADWARKNKGSHFYLKHESGMFRKIKAK